MNIAAFKQTFFPFLQWLPSISRNTRPDLEAGFIGAILILPQAIALATLAGMPPHYGIYTSIIPVIITSLWGSSWHTLSGPNTAVCVMIAFSVAPFASASTEAYIGFVLVLTLMVGFIQLSVGLLRLGTILDFISHTVISALVLAVGFLIVVSAGSSYMGTLANLGEPFFVRSYQLIQDIPRANLFALFVGSITIISGIIAKRFWKRYALVIAVIIGSISSAILNGFFGSATTQLELIGHLSVSALPFSMPSFDFESMQIMSELFVSAFAIAFLGLMQTVVISRSIATKSDQIINTNQEILAQGYSNIVASFFSSFASSGSFNRSAVNYEAGAKTPMAGIYASVLLLGIVFAAAPLISYMPTATIAGVLILVGWGLIDLNEVKRALLSYRESFIFFSTLFTALIFGLNQGVFIGVFISLVLYLWNASTPNVFFRTHTARDGRPVKVVTIDGNLFFGAVRYVEKYLSSIHEETEDRLIILIRTDHLTYIDVPGALMLAGEAKRRREQGDEFYIYIMRDEVIDMLKLTGMYQVFKHEDFIYQHKDHPMKSIIYPEHVETGQKTKLEKHNKNAAVNVKRRGISMEEIAKRLRSTRLIGPLDTDQIDQLLKSSEIKTADKDEILLTEYETLKNHLILLEGDIESQRLWKNEDGSMHSYTKQIKTPANITGGFAYISAATNNVRLRATTNVKYIELNADAIDELLGWSAQLSLKQIDDPVLLCRVNLVKHTRVFQTIPMENVVEAIDRMNIRKVEAGETIVTQGEQGDAYYIIESGEAEVWKEDPFTEETDIVARFHTGDAFGEESLLQNAFRNATVKMTTPGRLLVLEKKDFDELVQPHYVEEISAADAVQMINEGQARLLDCRYDMEFEDSRIPSAIFLPLDRMRWDVHNINPGETHIVYCRSGRRSRAAAFLLKERNIKALSLKGGIKGWPYEIDDNYVDIEETNLTPV